MPWDGATVYIPCKVFLPVAYEIDGSNKKEEAVRRWTYYNGASYRIKNLNGSPTIWWSASSPQTRTSPVYCYTKTGSTSTDQNAKVAQRSSSLFRALI